MIKDYIEEILDGKKTYDVRTYPTYKRGLIGLVDSKSMKLFGTIELTGCREITANEYCAWHKTGKYQNIEFKISEKTPKFYAYDFANPQKLAYKPKINVEKHTWIAIPETIDLFYLNSLF